MDFFRSGIHMVLLLLQIRNLFHCYIWQVNSIRIISTIEVIFILLTLLGAIYKINCMSSEAMWLLGRKPNSFKQLHISNKFNTECRITQILYNSFKISNFQISANVNINQVVSVYIGMCFRGWKYIEEVRKMK